MAWDFSTHSDGDGVDRDEVAAFGEGVPEMIGPVADPAANPLA